MRTPDARPKFGLKERINALVTPTVAVAGFALSVYILQSFAFGTRDPFPSLDTLETSRGVVIALEKDSNDSVKLRLSDSERWYSPQVTGGDEEVLHERLRNAREAAIVTVLHSAEPSTPPTEGSRWRVRAYVISIDDAVVLTYERARIFYDEHESSQFWIGTLCASLALLLSPWAWHDLRKATRQNR